MSKTLNQSTFDKEVQRNLQLKQQAHNLLMISDVPVVQRIGQLVHAKETVITVKNNRVIIDYNN